ncbi:MAG TPA: hypothetical protein VFD32_13390 [Dehalococcoidia bacterium]|nr:hypothetical protein [Dehalococcoidia bacterium]
MSDLLTRIAARALAPAPPERTRIAMTVPADEPPPVSTVESRPVEPARLPAPASIVVPVTIPAPALAAPEKAVPPPTVAPVVEHHRHSDRFLATKVERVETVERTHSLVRLGTPVMPPPQAPPMPPAAVRRRDSNPSTPPSAPSVTVSIGRIEVRAQPAIAAAPTPPPIEATAPAPSDPDSGLSEFLRGNDSWRPR